LNTKENELLQRERDLSVLKDSLEQKQEESRAERDKLQLIAQELAEKERLISELILR
jgi:hypothetical protein